MRPWQIPACSVPLADAVALFQRLPDATDLPPDVRLGEEIGFWQTVTHLALETLAQQKVLPSLVVGEGKGAATQARWMPVLDGPRDGPRLAQLRKAMPPVCRADANAKTTPTPHDLLTGYLHELIDALARRWGQTPALGQRARGPAADWPHALLRSDATLAGSDSQVSRLVQSHRAWLRSLYAAGDAHFRVAYRLEAPAQQSVSQHDGWMLHYLIQSRDDPSLLVPANALWQKQRSSIDALGARLENPQEMLLTGLGHTARLFPPLRRSLDEKRPASAALTTQEAYSFLRETAPLLEASGFGVLVPPWWNKPGTRLGVRLRMEGKQSTSRRRCWRGLLTLDNLVRYRWELALGGEALSREEFAALVALKSPLVQMRGQWVQLDPDQVEAAIRFWEKEEQQGEAGLLDAMQMGLGADEVDGLPSMGWRPPAGSRNGWSTLRARKRWPCFRNRLGCTQRCALTSRTAIHGSTFSAAGGLAPAWPTTWGWARRSRRWPCCCGSRRSKAACPGRCCWSARPRWSSTGRRRRSALHPTCASSCTRALSACAVRHCWRDARQTDLVATSYALVRRDGESLQRIDWFGVILDEAQNIKNPSTRQARQIRSLPATFRLALTGTPVENRLTELWSIMHFLNPGFLGSTRASARDFALPIERYDDAEAAQRLRQLISPFILRRVKTDPTVIQDLPEKQETKDYCTLSQEQATLYEAVVQDALAEHRERRGDAAPRAGAVDADEAQADLQPSGPIPAPDRRRVHARSAEEQRSGKLARLVELLEELLDCRRPCADLYAIRRDGWTAAQLLAASLWRAGALLARRHTGPPARRDGGALPGRRRAARPSSCFR